VTATQTLGAADAGVRSPKHLRRFAAFSLFAALYTFALVVFGGFVRITDSGMGCGDDWPKCNGRWIPEFTFPTLIEYTHRLLGVSIGLVLIGVFVYAFIRRREPGFGGRGGVLRIAALVLTLVVVQGLLGAVTVWLEIPPIVVVVHFATALLIMGILLVGYVRGRELAATSKRAANAAAPRYARIATIAAALGFIVVVFGALVANNLGAPQACQGFPLCNGSAIPSGGGLVHIHWTHRLVAFALFFYVLYGAFATWRTTTARVRYAASAAAAIVIAQLVVAAALVLTHLPQHLQALHLAVGAAVWGALVLWAAYARADARLANLTPRA
jgi:heme A synthase